MELNPLGKWTVAMATTSRMTYLPASQGQSDRSFDSHYYRERLTSGKAAGIIRGGQGVSQAYPRRS